MESSGFVSRTKIVSPVTIAAAALSRISTHSSRIWSSGVANPSTPCCRGAGNIAENDSWNPGRIEAA